MLDAPHASGEGGGERAAATGGLPAPSPAAGACPPTAPRVQLGRLLGIARHGRPRGPMETVGQVAVDVLTGIHGDYRGALKPGRNKRQVTLMSLAAWQAALRELGRELPWQERRVNLLVDGLDLAHGTGAAVRFPGGVALEITGECDPCSRMDELAPGLKAALRPHWRGGALARVVAAGRLTVGDRVEMTW